MNYTVNITDSSGEEHFKFTASLHPDITEQESWGTDAVAYCLMEAMFSLNSIPTQVGRKTPEEPVEMMYNEIKRTQ